MLKNIRLHLDTDDDKQAALEQQLSERIALQYKKNTQAFRATIPSLLPLVSNIQTQNIALFCNKFGEHNIVDYGVGRTLYGLEPLQEIQKQVEVQTAHCPYIDFSTPAPAHANEASKQLSELPQYQYYQAQAALPEAIEVLVVLGIGLAEHIRELINQYQIKHLVIYEPETQYFQCSVLVSDWAEMLKQATAKGTALYLQTGKDGRNLLADMDELAEHFPIQGFYLYQHYNHPVFNALTKSLTTKSWQQLKRDGLSFSHAEETVNYLPNWTQSVDLQQFNDVNPDDDKQFQANLSAFKMYFPAIYQEFKEYLSRSWLPVKNALGEVNVVKMDSLHCWYGDSPKQECILNFENFDKHPNKDGLVLGYKGTKLKHYTHYKFVNQTEKLLNDVEEEQGQLPSVIKSLIMFGIGSGYQIQHLFETHQVEKLFLCEPNRDFFYASLFAIDWQSILQTVDKSDARLYINIGDDGSNLFRDLLNQFYSIGPYILASTYFYQSYFNANLVNAIAQLREQLQVVISMGEYYDHARYGIAQTTETINRDYPLLTTKPYNKLSYDNKSVPVFMVGNGPSLDSAIDAIKEWQGQAIVISCGTSLQVLHKNGIVPDFHAEIEQNRATFDWCCRVGDFDYLKQISLLSCNGIHPDTCDLFKDVYIAFKEGESSTTSALQILGETEYEKLKFAFPTVSNFVMNLFTSMQFNQLYLIGIDLGFFDNKQHHSKQSGYYDQNGEEMYDYAAKNNIAMVVPGNFRKTVFTKHEFKVSKAILEQSLAATKVDCFNCSDGAKIIGTIPLRYADILVTATEQNKQQALTAIKSQAFTHANQHHDYSQRFLAKFQPERLDFELGKMIERVEMPVTTLAEAEGLIESQKSMLFASYQEGKSLLFYLLYGTVNYANAVFSKLLSSSADEQLGLEPFNQAKQMWLDTLKFIYGDVIFASGLFDNSSSFALQREKLIVRSNVQKYKLIYFIPPNATDRFSQFLCWWLGHNHLCKSKNSDHFIENGLVAGEQLPSSVKMSNGLEIPNLANEKNVLLLGNSNYFLNDDVSLSEENLFSKVCYLESITTPELLASVFNGERPYIIEEMFASYTVRFFLDIHKIAYFVPKLYFAGASEKQHKRYLNKLEKQIGKIDGYIEFLSYLAVPRESIKWQYCLVDQLGNRGKYIKGQIQLNSLIGEKLSEKQLRKIKERFNAL